MGTSCFVGSLSCYWCLHVHGLLKVIMVARRFFFSCLAAFLAVCFLIVVVILAWQSYHGRQTADEVLKDGVLYLISLSFSWLYWKHCASSQNSSPTSQPQPTPSSGYELVTRQ